MIILAMLAACGHPDHPRPPAAAASDAARDAAAAPPDAGTIPDAAPIADAMPPADADPDSPVIVGAITLTWGMTVEDGQLRIDYTVANGLGRRVYVNDQIIKGPRLAPDAVLVVRGADPRSVRFIRGFFQTDHEAVAAVGPAARLLEPGGVLRATGHVPLPLEAWVNYSWTEPLDDAPTTATLEVDYCEDPGDAYVETFKLRGDGAEVTQVDAYLLPLIGDAQPIPSYPTP